MLVDASGDDPVAAYEIVCGELENYGAGLADKPQIVALNKIDAVDVKTRDKLAKKLAKKSGVEVMLLSGASGEGLEPVLDHIIEILGPAPDAVAANAAGEEPWSPI